MSYILGQEKPPLDELVIHYGVRGMKWGVRKDRSGEKLSKVTNSRGERITKADAKWERSAANRKKGFAAYNKAADAMNKTHIPQINNKPEYKGKDLNGDTPLSRRYFKEMETAFVAEFNQNLRAAFGDSPSGEYKVVAYDASIPPKWTIDYTELKHEDYRVDVDMVLDALGHISSISIDDSTLEHAEEELLHADGISLQEAARIVKRELVDCSINAAIEWEGKWVFSAYTSNFDEGELDPFYSVDMKTGEFAGFSIVGDQDTTAILDAFSATIEHGDTSEGFLAHYGVKGMRWGVRKDPKSGGKSSAKSSGPSKASKNAELALNVTKPFYSMFVPRASIMQKTIQVGQAAAAGMPMKVAMKTAAGSPLAIAGYAVTGLDSGGYRIPVVAAKNLKRGGWPKDKTLADPKLDVDGIQKKVVAQINPDYPGLGTTNNCLRCTYTYEMRRRGYDVAATKTILASGQTALGPKVMTKSIRSSTKIKSSNKPTGIKGLLGKRPTAADAFKALAGQPDGSRGDFQMSWGMLMGGHSIAYEIVRGKPVFFDTQSGKTYSTPQQLNSLTNRAVGLRFNRLDNKSLNSVAMTAWVKDKKE